MSPTPARRPPASRRWPIAGLLALGAVIVVSALPVAAQQPASPTRTRFADPAFERVWAASDAPVAGGEATRSWLWGPAPVAAASEAYGEGAGGRRLVQYFDKSRMEITYPTADRGQPWFVTNGLLTKELMSGQLQIGDDQYITAEPAKLPVAGDPDSPDAPSYAAFRGVATFQGDNRAVDRTGQPLDQAINGGGRVRTIEPRARDDAYRFARFEPSTGHNILGAFWDSMTRLPNADWLFVMGYPITEPYWARVNLNGKQQDIVVQLFERRVLTYTPSNRAEWRVEMGNIGQHYYRWRYPNTSPAPLVTMEPATPGLPIRARGFNWRAGDQVRVAVARFGEGPGVSTFERATVDERGAFEVTLDWGSAAAVLYDQAGTNLELWAGNTQERDTATAPFQVGNKLTERITGTAVDVARGARTVRLLLDTGVIKQVVLTDQAQIRRLNGTIGSLADLNTGARLIVTGSPGNAGALLATIIDLRQ